MRRQKCVTLLALAALSSCDSCEEALSMNLGEECDTKIDNCKKGLVCDPKGSDKEGKGICRDLSEAMEDYLADLDYYTRRSCECVEMDSVKEMVKCHKLLKHPNVSRDAEVAIQSDSSAERRRWKLHRRGLDCEDRYNRRIRKHNAEIEKEKAR